MTLDIVVVAAIAVVASVVDDGTDANATMQQTNPFTMHPNEILALPEKLSSLPLISFQSSIRTSR